MFVKYCKLGVKNKNGRIYERDSFVNVPDTVPLYEDVPLPANSPIGTPIDNEKNNLIGQLYNIREENGFMCCDIMVDKSFKPDLLSKKMFICSSGFGDILEETGLVTNYYLSASFISPWSAFGEWYEIENDVIPEKQLEFDFKG